MRDMVARNKLQRRLAVAFRGDKRGAMEEATEEERDWIDDTVQEETDEEDERLVSVLQTSQRHRSGLAQPAASTQGQAPPTAATGPAAASPSPQPLRATTADTATAMCSELKALLQVTPGLSAMEILRFFARFVAAAETEFQFDRVPVRAPAGPGGAGQGRHDCCVRQAVL